MQRKDFLKGSKPARHPDRIANNFKSLNSNANLLGSNYNVTVKGNLGEEYAEFEKCIF